jgi:putative ABC transport system ATP-binding protein
MSSIAVIQLEDVTKSYRRKKVSVPAVNGIDLEVGKGEIIGIIGPSGSGKSTLLNIIGGLDKARKGKVVIDGRDLGELDDKALTRFRLERVGFIFQFYNLISTLTAVENVELPMSLAGVPNDKRREKATDLLREVGLEHRLNHLPEEMSGGEQQRVAVARALANEPALILGDEPTGDLDSKSAKKLMELIRLLRREKKVTFVLVTHDPIVVEACDKVYSVRDGKITKEFSQTDIVHTKMSHDRDAMSSVY